jgi:MYXO-CTERM domain-containing protein
VSGAIALSWPAPSRATYSITALDRESGEVGGSGASCVPYSVDLIYGAVAGRAALNSQAFFVEELKAEALSLLTAGASAESVLAAVTNAAVYPESAKTQWGIVDAAGGFASFTGPDALAFAGDSGRVSADGRFVFTVQGNLLTSRLVLDQAAAAFEARGCDLAERLMLGLEAASAGGEGDGRCTPEGRPAKSAYLNVTRPDGSAVHISIPDVAPADPVALLRASYDSYRADFPCPAVPTPVHERRNDASTSGCSVSADQSSRGPGAALALLALVLVRRLRQLG